MHGFAQSDFNTFQAIHVEVHEAWCNPSQWRHLRHRVTPEMYNYIIQLSKRQRDQGIQNIITNIELLDGKVAESWQGDTQYATAYLRWRAIDYYIALNHSPGMRGHIISGDPNRPIERTEIWTFVRRRGYEWLLAAVQQV